MNGPVEQLMFVQGFLECLEQFAARHGVPVVRDPLDPFDALDAFVSGRMERHRIVLRGNMSEEQQLFTLIHELTHLIAHCNVSPRVDRTICEYEADAVEKLVGAQLGVAAGAGEPPADEATDDLLASSVARVQWAARTLTNAAQGRFIA